MAWDATMRIVENKTDKQMAHIVFSRFTNGDTQEGIRFSLGGLYVHPVVKHVSINALAEIKRHMPEAIVPGGVEYKRIKGLSRLRLTREHVIPVSELAEQLKTRFDRGDLMERDILAIMDKLEIALITVDENRKFKGGLAKSMPSGWWNSEWWNSEALDPFDRYRAAGLDDSIWADFECVGIRGI